MFVIKLALIVLWFLLVPGFLGLMFQVKILKNSDAGVASALVTGYLLYFALFYVLTMPLLIANASLTFLAASFACITMLITLVSTFICRDAIKPMIVSFIAKLKKLSLVMIIALLLIILQAGVLTVYQHIDDDDAFYVATSTTAVETNTIVEFDPYTGNALKSYHMRYVMSPFPVFTAVLSKLVFIHPAIVAHTVFPAMFIPLAYMIFYLLAKKYFKNHTALLEYSLLFMALLTMMGNVSIYTSSTFLLFRIWQGKAMLANIILPSILLFSSYAMSNRKINPYWFVVFAAVLAGCLTTSMAVALIPLMLGTLSIIYTIINKSLKPILLGLFCCLPCIVNGLIYII